MSGGSNPSRSSGLSSSSLEGESIAGIELRKALNSGAVGTVYRGFDQFLQQEAAVTVVHPRLLKIEGFCERLQREVEAAIDLKQGNNSAVLRYKLMDPWMLIVSRFIDGVSVRSHLTERGRFDPRRAFWITLRLLRALQHAHDLKLAHKDIKPENLLVTSEPEVYLVGWGLLRIINATTSEPISSYGSLFGTPEYMAPDQITIGDHGPRTDLYSVGLTLFELLSGVQPFAGRTITETLKKQLVEPVPPINEFVPDAPGPVNDLIQSLTAKDPGQRPANVDEVIAAMLAIIPDLETVPPEPLQPPSQSMSKRETAKISAITQQALQALAERMQNSANLGMLAFETDESYPPEQEAPSEPNLPANTQQLVTAALDTGVEQALKQAMEVGKVDKVVPAILEQLWRAERTKEILDLEGFLKAVMPSHAVVSFYAGLCREKDGRLEEAAREFADTLRLEPHHLPAALHSVRCLTELGRVDQAEDTLAKAVRACPSSDVAAAKYAEFLYVVKGDGEAAAPAYERAITLAPNRLNLRQQLAWILVEINELDRAELVLKELIEWSGDPETATVIAREIEKKREIQKSSGAHLAPGPENVLAVFWPNWQNRQATLADWETRREKYLNVPMPPEVAPRPKSKLRKRLAKIHKAMGERDFKKVADLARMGLGDEPQSIPLLMALGQADLELGEYKEAIKVYRFVLRLDPDMKEARANLEAARAARKQS